LTSAHHVAACHHPKNGCFDDGTLFTSELVMRRYGHAVLARSCALFFRACARPAFTDYAVKVPELKQRVEVTYPSAAAILVLMVMALGIRPKTGPEA